jgi:hypothetical protein
VDVKVTDVSVAADDQVTAKVASIRAASALTHFVTVKGDADAQIVATLNIDTPDIRQRITWEGAQSPGSGLNPLTARVSRTQAGRKDVAIKLDGHVIWKGVVWVVWAELTGTPARNPASPKPLFDHGNRVATEIEFDLIVTATITPAEMFDTTKDIPDLTQQLPGDASLAGTDPVDGSALSGGVSALWDMSRRKTIRAFIADQNGGHNEHNFTGLPADVTCNYPADPVVGNDDSSPNDEDNNPYAPAHRGAILGSDTPFRRTPGLLVMQNGKVGDNYNSKVWFQDFARLRLGGRWLNISDPLSWRVEFNYRKKLVTRGLWNLDGNPDAAVTEADMGRDVDGDGAVGGDVGYWDDRPDFGSYTAKDNAGLPAN